MPILLTKISKKNLFYLCKIYLSQIKIILHWIGSSLRAWLVQLDIRSLLFKNNYTINMNNIRRETLRKNILYTYHDILLRYIVFENYPMGFVSSLSSKIDQVKVSISDLYRTNLVIMVLGMHEMPLLFLFNTGSLKTPLTTGLLFLFLF